MIQNDRITSIESLTVGLSLALFIKIEIARIEQC
jgi:hypothetical protein